MTDKKRFLAAAKSSMPSIPVKIAFFKAFGVYPADDEYEFVIRPDIVKNDCVYVFDREAGGVHAKIS